MLKYVLAWTTFVAQPVASLAADFENVLSIQYNVTCTDRSPGDYPGVQGALKMQGRTLRLELLKYRNEIEVSLGAISPGLQAPDVELLFEPSNTCELRYFVPRISVEYLTSGSERELALQHSPFVVVRDDQYADRSTDAAMEMTYSVVPLGGGLRRILYNIFLAGENRHGLFVTSSDTSMGRYGRRTDIEWVYSVDLDGQNHIVGREYQGGLIFGIGHKTRRFKGSFIGGTDHPILYTTASHNVFSDKPDGRQKKSLEGYHFAPRTELVAPEAREWWMLRNPWSFDISDRQLIRQRDLDRPSDEYLYVLIDGKLHAGDIRVSVKESGAKGETPAGGTKKSEIKSLGGGLWGRQTLSAIPLSEGVHGAFYLRTSSQKTQDFSFHAPLRFFRLMKDASQGFAVREVTSSFTCFSGGGNLRAACDF